MEQKVETKFLVSEMTQLYKAKISVESCVKLKFP